MRLRVLKHLLPELLLRQTHPQLPLVVRVGLQLRLHHVVLAVTLLAGVGDHRRSGQHLRVLLHFVAVRLLNTQQVERHPFDVFDVWLTEVFALLGRECLIFKLEVPDVHVFQSDQQFEIDEVERRKEVLVQPITRYLHVELLPYNMEHPYPRHRLYVLPVSHRSLKRLDLVLASTRGRQLNVPVLVEHHRHEVMVLSFDPLPPIVLQRTLLLLVEVQPVSQESTQVRVFSENQEVHA